MTKKMTFRIVVDTNVWDLGVQKLFSAMRKALDDFAVMNTPDAMRAEWRENNASLPDYLNVPVRAAVFHHPDFEPSVMLLFYGEQDILLHLSQEIITEARIRALTASFAHHNKPKETPQ